MKGDVGGGGEKEGRERGGRSRGGREEDANENGELKQRNATRKLESLETLNGHKSTCKPPDSMKPVPVERRRLTRFAHGGSGMLGDGGESMRYWKH